jgi:hypothetical protein
MGSGALTTTQASRPCQAFGHTEGRYAGGRGHCIICASLHAALWKMMWVDGNKLILGLRGTDACAAGNYSGAQVAVNNGRFYRKWYATRRARGLSSYAAKSRTPAAYKKQQQATRKRYAARWGGHPIIGSRAWVEREAHKLAVKLQAIGG